jgi:hypothetical protein
LAGQDAVINEWAAVYQAELYPDGSLGTWIQTTSLPKTLAAHAATAIRDGILVTGGWSTPDPVSSIQKKAYWAPLSSDCSLGSWIELTPLPYGTYRHALIATDDHVYNLGGSLANVMMAPLHLNNDAVQQGRYNHQFLLGDNYPIEALHWTESGSGDTEINIRYRIGDTYTGEYGAWSDFFSTPPVIINSTGGFLEYEVEFEDGSSLDEKYVTEISLSLETSSLVYLPLVVKD